MPAAKGSIDEAKPLMSPLTIFALVAALLAFTAAKKFGQPLLDKALPK